MDTIFAAATAPGRSGVAVIRLSGPQAHSIAMDICGSIPKSKGLRNIIDRNGRVVDQALVLNFPGRASFTGEPVVELHVHGSPAVIKSVLALLGSFSEARPAEAGEFTRRALENGKLDLSQVEGLADLIDSETEAQRRQAMRVFEGGLAKKAKDWRDNLVRSLALLEATIDFADEDVPTDVYPEVQNLIAETVGEIRTEISGSYAAERLRNGFEVAIVGEPNVGKSTLLNRLAGRDAAITSEIAGTTRDVIEVQMDLGGIPVTLVDTAGVRVTDDSVEQIGVERARRRAETADLRVFLIENNKLPEIRHEEKDIIRFAKVDEVDAAGVGISGKTGEGVEDLIKEIVAVFEGQTSSVGVAIKERHRLALIDCENALLHVQSQIEHCVEVDLISEELKAGIRSVDMIVGRVDVEDLLGEIFSSFCIGK